MLIENTKKHEKAIASAGERAIERAKKAGAASYYVDPTLGDGIIKELPDGTRQRVLVTDDQDDIVLEVIDTPFHP